jgi:hypothetical protein
VGHLRAAAATLGIGLIADLMPICLVQGGAGISPSESHRRTTGGDTLQTAAAWRTEVTFASSTIGLLVTASNSFDALCRRNAAYEAKFDLVPLLSGLKVE